MAITNKWNGNGQSYSREEDISFLELFSRALEESIRDNFDDLMEVQKREFYWPFKDEQRK